jgi:hypothetical protein
MKFNYLFLCSLIAGASLYAMESDTPDDQTSSQNQLDEYRKQRAAHFARKQEKETKEKKHHQKKALKKPTQELLPVQTEESKEEEIEVDPILIPGSSAQIDFLAAARTAIATARTSQSQQPTEDITNKPHLDLQDLMANDGYKFKRLRLLKLRYKDLLDDDTTAQLINAIHDTPEITSDLLGEILHLLPEPPHSSLDLYIIISHPNFNFVLDTPRASYMRKDKGRIHLFCPADVMSSIDVLCCDLRETMETNIFISSFVDDLTTLIQKSRYDGLFPEQYRTTITNINWLSFFFMYLHIVHANIRHYSLSSDAWEKLYEQYRIVTGNEATPDGTSALMFAVAGGYVELVKELLARGANPFLMNQYGDNALSVIKTFLQNNYVKNPTTYPYLHYTAIYEKIDTLLHEYATRYIQPFEQGFNFLSRAHRMEPNDSAYNLLPALPHEIAQAIAVQSFPHSLSPQEFECLLAYEAPNSTFLQRLINRSHPFRYMFALYSGWFFKMLDKKFH